MTRYQPSTLVWEQLDLADQRLWAAKAVAHQQGDLSEILNAVEKPWNYRDEVQDYWRELLKEDDDA